MCYQRSSQVCAFVAVFVAVILLASPVKADVIYSDTFGGADGTALADHTLNVTTGGNSWSTNANAGQSWTLQSGAATMGAGSMAGAAWLPFAPTSGNVYTLVSDRNGGRRLLLQLGGHRVFNRGPNCHADVALRRQLPGKPVDVFTQRFYGSHSIFGPSAGFWRAWRWQSSNRQRTSLHSGRCATISPSSWIRRLTMLGRHRFMSAAALAAPIPTAGLRRQSRRSRSA